MTNQESGGAFEISQRMTALIGKQPLLRDGTALVEIPGEYQEGPDQIRCASLHVEGDDYPPRRDRVRCEQLR